MKKISLFLFVAFFTHLALAQTAYKDYQDGKVYVKFSKIALKSIASEDPEHIPATKLAFLKGLESKYGIVRVSKPFHHASDDAQLPYILRIDFKKIFLVDHLVEELAQVNGAEYAEKVPLSTTGAVANDPLFATTNGSTHLTQINAQNAWNVFHGGSNITVAIVDNAVMWSHVDLQANTYTNTSEIAGNNIDDDNNGYVDDRNGWDVADNDNNAEPPSPGMFHGTHCAGIAGAVTDNNIGVSSIGWNIKIIPVKGESNTSGSNINVTYGYQGIIYAVRAKARIISCSWNSFGFSISEQAVMDYAWNHGSIMIASASNIGTSTIQYPGGYNHVYCVAAVESNDVKASYSSYGSWVDICAPGSNVLSTYPYTTVPDYQPATGTSMATPLVAGLAALMLSKSPQMTPMDVLNCISSTAANIYTLAGNSSFSGQLGAGRIDAFAAMNCAAAFSTVAPIANFYGFPLNVCPSTPVNFYDSSIYVPSSYSWVFQGGTPATSTLQNPVVTYAAPGTYSVSLTATNANGTHTKTKLSYVTVAGPNALNLVEGFQSATFLPAGWSPKNIGNDALYWKLATGVGGFGTSTACAMFDNYNYEVAGDRDEMRTPRYDFSNVASAKLSFDVAFARLDAFSVDSLEVKVSTNCGVSWTSIYYKGGLNLATAPDNASFFTPTSSQWRTDMIDITSLTAGQGNVMFSFINHGHFGQVIYLDNINLSFPNFTLSAQAPASGCENTAVTLTNTTVGPAVYNWSFPGGSPANSAATNPTVSYAGAGTYTYSMAGFNGTVSGAVTKTITISQNPTLSVSPSTLAICNAGVGNINALGATNYSLNGVSVVTPITVSPTTSGIYTVTGANGSCSDSKTVVVTLHSVTPVQISPLPSASICAGKTATLTASGNYASFIWLQPSVANASAVVTPSNTSTYTVVGLNDPHGCNSGTMITIVVYPNPLSVISSTSSGCGTSCFGVVNATTSSGVGPYTYSLSGATCTLMPCTNLCAGSYTLLTTDAQACSSNTVFTITPSLNNLVAVISTSNASCNNCSDGALDVGGVLGGTAPYSYTWNPSGGNSAQAMNLAPGCYTVDISDALGCAKQATACVGVTTGIGVSLPDVAQLMIFPNPASRSVNVVYPGKVFDCTIYNELGQSVSTRRNISGSAAFNTESFSKGIYVLELNLSGQRLRKKLVIE